MATHCLLSNPAQVNFPPGDEEQQLQMSPGMLAHPNPTLFSLLVSCLCRILQDIQTLGSSQSYLTLDPMLRF